MPSIKQDLLVRSPLGMLANGQPRFLNSVCDHLGVSAIGTFDEAASLAPNALPVDAVCVLALSVKHVPRQRLPVCCIHIIETLLDRDWLFLWCLIRSGLPALVVQLLKDLVDLPPIRALVVLFSLVFEVGVQRFLFITARQVAQVTFISLSEVIFLLIGCFLVVSFKVLLVLILLLRILQTLVALASHSSYSYHISLSSNVHYRSIASNLISRLDYLAVVAGVVGVRMPDRR